jgi:hypothetical protein
MQIPQIAVIEASGRISQSDLLKACAAMQKQVSRDLVKYYPNANAIIQPFLKKEDVPPSYWLVQVVDKLEYEGCSGYHTDDNGQPLAFVSSEGNWTLTLSHEILEMLIDPYGNALRTCSNPFDKGAKSSFLIEICDPSEAYSYQIDGITVSDFYTPNYFDKEYQKGTRYSFTGVIKKPLTLLKGGYISWINPIDNCWYQATFFKGAKPIIKRLGRKTDTSLSNRAFIDRLSERNKLRIAFLNKTLKNGN